VFPSPWQGEGDGTAKPCPSDEGKECLAQPGNQFCSIPARPSPGRMLRIRLSPQGRGVFPSPCQGEGGFELFCAQNRMRVRNAWHNRVINFVPFQPAPHPGECCAFAYPRRGEACFLLPFKKKDEGEPNAKKLKRTIRCCGWSFFARLSFRRVSQLFAEWVGALLGVAKFAFHHVGACFTRTLTR